MCGIAGILHHDGTCADPRQIAPMLAAIGHRGPDDRGVYTAGPVGLGHVRLSIIDLSGGRQPMGTTDGQLCVTFNGEIFNYVELRDELEARGRRFATRSDTEVILHAYAEYGDQCVQHFNGQWAFALWDVPRRRLLLSRDRLGIRPLFYTTAGGKFLFASEIKALLTDADVPRRIDPVGLRQTFTYWSTLPPHTVFEGISELPPGHNLVLAEGRRELSRYWQLDYRPDERLANVDDCAEQLLDLLADATRLRLRADVPVGAYLSGGLDSSVTTALVQQWNDAGLRTFSITFDDAEFDESRYQRQVAAALRTEHQAFPCSNADIGRVFPEVVWHAERPILRTAPAPLYLLSRAVREAGFKVVLTGEGADEMLGGYDIFKEAKLRRFCAAQPDSPRRGLLFDKLYPYLPGLQAQSLAYRKAFFRTRPEDLDSPLFSHLPRWELTARLHGLLSPEFDGSASGDTPATGYNDCLAMLPPEFAGWPPLCQAQFLETATLLPGYILSSQGDRVAMAHAVEGRFPFLDYRVAEFAARIPPRLKMRGLKEKYILKRAARGLVPADVLARPKQPYRAPDARSFFAPGAGQGRFSYVDELLAPAAVRRGGVFSPAAVTQLLRKVQQAERLSVKDNMALVGVLSTQLLIEHFINGKEPSWNRLPQTCVSSSATISSSAAS